MTPDRNAASERSSRNLVIQGAIFVIVCLIALPFIADRVTLVGRSLERPLRGRYSGDFYAFYGAGVLYNDRHDGTAYNLDELRAVEYAAFPVLHEFPNWVGGEVTPFRNPPFFLPVVGYFSQFGSPVAYNLMAVVNTLLLGIAVGMTGGLAVRRAAPLAVLAWGGLALAAYHAWYGILYSQLPSYITVVALVLGILALRGNHELLAGLALSVLAIKPQYAIPIFVFLSVTRRWDAVFGFVVGGALFGAVSLAVVGPEGIVQFVATTAEVSLAPGYMYGNVFEDMFNWRALLQLLFAGNMVIITPTQIALTLISYALAIWAWRAPSRGRLWHADIGLCILVLLMLLASPHAHAQDVIFLLPVAALILHHTWSEDTRWGVTLASAAGAFAVFWFLSVKEPLGPRIHTGALTLALLFGFAVYIQRSKLVERLPSVRRTGASAPVLPNAEASALEEAPPAS